jgi:NAD(P)-dependent dehydrogenase (short-subunit alcohol dehydrogenase family)
MSTAHAPELLRAGLLDGVTVALAHAGVAAAAGGDRSIAHAVQAGCGGRGARVLDLPLSDGGGALLGEDAIDAAVERLLGESASVEMLVVDGAGLYAAGAGRAALVESMQACWSVTRTVVNRAFMAEASSPPPRRIVLVAPAPGAGEHADAARAALENLARTLSIEWSRHAITPVAIAPGEDTAADEVAALVAYLASPAGAYFSGCLLDLRGPSYS